LRKSNENKDFSTQDQIKRAALSTMNNIAEGFGRYSNKEFIRFWSIQRLLQWKSEVCCIFYLTENTLMKLNLKNVIN